jgi:hypothetical protein
LIKKGKISNIPSELTEITNLPPIFRLPSK